jgi:hypothetical protein
MNMSDYPRISRAEKFEIVVLGLACSLAITTGTFALLSWGFGL